MMIRILLFLFCFPLLLPGADTAWPVNGGPYNIRYTELTQITPVPDWLTVEKEQFSGKVSRIPTREEIAPIVNEQLIVELYSK